MSTDCTPSSFSATRFTAPTQPCNNTQPGRQRCGKPWHVCRCIPGVTHVLPIVRAAAGGRAPSVPAAAGWHAGVAPAQRTSQAMATLSTTSDISAAAAAAGVAAAAPLLRVCTGSSWLSSSRHLAGAAGGGSGGAATASCCATCDGLPAPRISIIQPRARQRAARTALTGCCTWERRVACTAYSSQQWGAQGAADHSHRCRHPCIRRVQLAEPAGWLPAPWRRRSCLLELRS